LLERDYILRLIEQLAQALARILRFKSSGSTEEAEQELSKLGESAFGLSLDLLLAMSVDDLMRLQSAGEKPDFDRLALLGRFFKERGCVESESWRAVRFFDKALRLWVIVLEQPTAKAMILHGEALRDLLSRLERAQLLEETRLELWRAYELTGDFARAENQLEELLQVDFQRFAPAGAQFYQRLLDRSDEELTAGNLPRDEIEEGLLRLEKIVAAVSLPRARVIASEACDEDPSTSK
jgi:hypothetical protein